MSRIVKPMLREYLRALPFVVGMAVVAAIALWLRASYGELAVVAGLVVVLAMVIGRVVWARARVERSLRDD